MINIEELSKEYKVTPAFVEETYKKTIEDSKDWELSPEETLIEVKDLLECRLREATSNSKGELYFGMVLAVDKIKDMANLPGKKPRRLIHIEEYVANPGDAIAKGKVAVFEITENPDKLKRIIKDKKTGTVKEDEVDSKVWEVYRTKVNDKFVVPLDNVEKWATGNKNFGYLRPLPINMYRTTMIIGIQSEYKYKIAELHFSSEKLPKSIPVGIPVDFVATPKEDKDGLSQLYSNKFTDFTPSTKDFGITPGELVNTLLSVIKYPISKLEEYHKMMVSQGKKWETLVMVEARVNDIRTTEKSTHITVIDSSRDEALKVWLHDGLFPLNYDIESKVYIIGRTSQSDKWEPETGIQKGVPGDVTVFAMGVIPKFQIKNRK